MTPAWLIILLSAAWVGYTWVGYPLALWLLARVSPLPITRAEPDAPAPPASLILAVHNGAAHLEKKLVDTLALDYAGPLQILVASDGSTDRTAEIAGAFADRGVELVETAERGGKESAQRAGIAAATGEILIFSDVTAELQPGALNAIVAPFADSTIGAVSSEDEVDSEEGEGAYVRFEMALRRMESEATSLVGLSGSFFAIRRALGEPWPIDLASDFRSGLEANRRGFRAVSEPRARARFRVTSDPKGEWTRKVRTVRRGLAVLSTYRDLLNPRYGRASFSLWGHKVARFTSPIALVLLFGTTGALAASNALAGILFLAQAAAYAAGGLSLISARVAEWRIPRLAGFFMLVNASMGVAWTYHLRGDRAVVWEPTKR